MILLWLAAGGEEGGPPSCQVWVQSVFWHLRAVPSLFCPALQVMKAVEDGFRLPAPANCQPPLHQLMLDCWQKDRSQRPKFSHIHDVLSKMVQSPQPPPCARYPLVPSPVVPTATQRPRSPSRPVCPQVPRRRRAPGRALLRSLPGLQLGGRVAGSDRNGQVPG